MFHPDVGYHPGIQVFYLTLTLTLQPTMPCYSKYLAPATAAAVSKRFIHLLKVGSGNADSTVTPSRRLSKLLKLTIIHRKNIKSSHLFKKNDLPSLQLCWLLLNIKMNSKTDGRGVRTNRMNTTHSTSK